MKIAIVHDWMTGMRGGEHVLLCFLELFPDADLYTLVYDSSKMDPIFQKRHITSSRLQKFPFGKTRYQYYLPLYWGLMGGFDISSYDLIVSSSSACAKWVRNSRQVPHFCYCHTPMRYIWDLFEDYFGPTASWPVRTAARFFRPYLQARDLESNKGVTQFLANSSETQERIKRIYGREAEILHPPLDFDRFKARTGKGDYFLVLSALVPYKKIELAIGVCSKRGWPLRIVGRGSEEKRLRSMAGPTVQFEGWASSDEVPALYAGAKALLFPGREDFGIVPLEALASGCPVVAYGEGGVKDTLEDGVTGVLFHEQTEESLETAMEKFQRLSFDPQELREKARPFSRDRFLFKAQVYIRRFLGIKGIGENES